LVLCERIDAFPRLYGGLLDDNEFGESGHKERPRSLEFFVAFFGERLDDTFDVRPLNIVRMMLRDFLNEPPTTWPCLLPTFRIVL
jgi:hypothetical protein